MVAMLGSVLLLIAAKIVTKLLGFSVTIAYALLNCVVAIVLIAVFGRVNLSCREKVCAG
jgi:hypothetical protein